MIARLAWACRNTLSTPRATSYRLSRSITEPISLASPSRFGTSASANWIGRELGLGLCRRRDPDPISRRRRQFASFRAATPLTSQSRRPRALFI
ncbi:hypothetical protein NL676_021834 [Syzygium grande]|nr:hypothetical protein NL676_021834 [Syzygium grande]